MQIQFVGIIIRKPFEKHCNTKKVEEPYRHGHPNPDSHSTMRVRIRFPMSVVLQDLKMSSLWYI